VMMLHRPSRAHPAQVLHQHIGSAAAVGVLTMHTSTIHSSIGSQSGFSRRALHFWGDNGSMHDGCT
jgi:hypothetical protein